MNAPVDREMIERRSWDEFQAAGLLWWINRTLHLFGWAIVVVVDNGRITDAYPARCRFRGFTGENETKGFTTLTHYMHEQARRLLAEVEE